MRKAFVSLDLMAADAVLAFVAAPKGKYLRILRGDANLDWEIQQKARYQMGPFLTPHRTGVKALE